MRSQNKLNNWVGDAVRSQQLLAQVGAICQLILAKLAVGFPRYVAL